MTQEGFRYVSKKNNTGPSFELKKVQMLVARAIENPNADLVFYSAPSKSTEAVIAVFRKKGARKFSVHQAREYILYRIYDLKPEHFFRTHAQQWPDPRRKPLIVDEYGLRHNGVPWFIKFHFDCDDDALEAISFHPLEKDMNLANGQLLEKVWSS